MWYKLLSGLGEPVQHVVQVVSIYCMEVKSKIRSNFIFQLASPGFLGNTLLQGGILTKTSFWCHQPEMTETLWLTVRSDEISTSVSTLCFGACSDLKNVSENEEKGA